ncbi:MAG TPA: formate/nitrite transporter family protein [Terriglobales bacterium]|nr:formate/nitrite transporter family protein [Terriglobales bacterium]
MPQPDVGKLNLTAMPNHAETANETRRLTASEIFEAAVENARSEVKRAPRTLAFSGLAGGLTMGLTGLGVASVRAILGPGHWQDLASYLIYPVGFIAVIIGRAQLFTENTLYPVILLLDERKYFLETFRLWAVVFIANVMGALLFAVLAVRSEALKPEIAGQLISLGTEAVHASGGQIFWSGIIGGWLIALVAWVVTASHWTIGQLVMVWLLTFIVGVGRFAHCIASSGEILSAVVSGNLPAITYLHWLLLATLGNIVGGVVIVSLLNYGQVRAQ